MIFVVLGTQKFPFNRLLMQIDNLIEQKEIKESVFAQIGHSDYEPRHLNYVRFLNKEEFDKKIEECSLLITHSGVGTIISGFRYHKPVIVVPRLEKYGEHVDNHQLEIAKTFSNKNYVLCCEENNLRELIEKSRDYQFDKYVSHRENLIDTIAGYLEMLN